MNEFINPKSMLTPGAAGALMVIIANALCAAFPEAGFRFVSLGLSFVFGLIVFNAAAIGIGEKVIYWLLNSLIIFATGVGASNIGANIESAARGTDEVSVQLPYSVASWLISDARAQPTGAPGAQVAPGGDSKNEGLRAEVAQALKENQELEQRVRDLERKNEALRSAAEKQGTKPTGFFRRW